VDSDGAVIDEARIVISAATDKPTRLLAAETLLRGAGVADALLRQAGEAAADEAIVIGDQHGTVAYKRQLVRVYVQRALRRALAPASTSL
jgi:carbon-monoxide dehydrogenase medium subunit